MADIYDRDFSKYSDAEFLSDIEALVQAKVPEGPTLEYKADISEKDGWLQDLVAFANSYGGLLFIGVAAPKGIPEAAPGFERSSEVAVDITNQIIACVQPRPDFQVKVAPVSGDPQRWLAAIRVKEGTNTPYLFSRADMHRIYVRGSSRKMEPDYLQLMHLIEKRKIIAERPNRVSGEIHRLRNAITARSAGNIVENFYRFIAVADPELGYALDNATEHAFGRSVLDSFAVDREQTTNLAHTMSIGPFEWHRTISDTTLLYFFTQDRGQKIFERKWLLSGGSVAFSTAASHTVAEDARFSLVDFVYDLLSFLVLACR